MEGEPSYPKYLTGNLSQEDKHDHMKKGEKKKSCQYGFFLIFCYAQSTLIVNQLGPHGMFDSRESVNEED